MSEQANEQNQMPLLVVEDGQDTPDEYSPQWGPTTRVIMTVLMIGAGIYTLTLLAPVFNILAIAFLIGYLIKSGADAISNRTRVSYIAAVALLYLTLLVVIIGLILVLIPPLVNGINNSINRARGTFEDLRISLRDYEAEDGLYEILGFELDLNPVIEPARDLLLQVEQEVQAMQEGTSNGIRPIETPPPPRTAVETRQLEQLIRQIFNVAGQVGTTLSGVFSTVSGILGTLILAILISIFTLIDLPKTGQSLFETLPKPYHREFILLLRAIKRVWDAFFRGSVLVSIVVTILTWGYLTLMGVPSAFVLAFVIGAFNLIPYISALITLVLLVVVPLFTGSTAFPEMSNATFAGLVFVGYLPISALIFNVIAPKIQGEAVNLPVSVVLIGIVIGTALGGIMGAFLAAPLMGTIRVMVVYVLNKIALQDPFPGQEISPP